MFEYLEGTLESRGPTRVVVDVGGVGYDVAVPVGASFPDTERVRVWTHLVVRDDAHLLFGFPTAGLREVFRLLLVVRGVGPALALAILSGLPGEELLTAIAAKDAKALTRIKGVGKKTAEQILLDLRDRAPALAPVVTPGATPSPKDADLIDDAVAALLSIGFTEKEARKSVARASKKVGTDDLEVLVRTALRG